MFLIFVPFILLGKRKWYINAPDNIISKIKSQAVMTLHFSISIIGGVATFVILRDNLTFVEELIKLWEPSVAAISFGFVLIYGIWLNWFISKLFYWLDEDFNKYVKEKKKKK